MFPFQSSNYPNWLNLKEYVYATNASINLFDAGDYSNSSLTLKMERKSSEARKRHKEAERRRRQRINAHLSTLRSLLPNTTKTDKASLLAEVVSHVKKMRRDICRNDSDESESWRFPTELDEATLSFCDDEAKIMKAIVCCEDRPGLVLDLALAIRSVRARAVRTEMMTVGGRTKNVVVLKWTGGVCGGEEDVEALKRALKAVVENRFSDPVATRNILGKSGSGLCLINLERDL